MKYFWVIVATLALSACGATEEKPSQPGNAMETAHIAAQAAVEACKNKHASGELTTYVDAALCANPPVVAAYRKANYPYMDLVYLGVSAKLAGAAKLDSGEITEDQFESQLAQLRTRIAAEETRRRSAAGTPVAGSADSLLAGLSAFAAAKSSSYVDVAPAVTIRADSTPAADAPMARSVADAGTPPPGADSPAAATATATAMATTRTASAPPAPPPSKSGLSGYRLQFGVFANQDNASKLTKAIATPEVQVSVETATSRAGRTLYYVRTPAYADLDKAQMAAKAAQAAAESQGFKEPVTYVVLPVGEAR